MSETDAKDYSISVEGLHCRLHCAVKEQSNEFIVLVLSFSLQIHVHTKKQSHSPVCAQGFSLRVKINAKGLKKNKALFECFFTDQEKTKAESRPTPNYGLKYLTHLFLRQDCVPELRDD